MITVLLALTTTNECLRIKEERSESREELKQRRASSKM